MDATTRALAEILAEFGRHALISNKFPDTAMRCQVERFIIGTAFNHTLERAAATPMYGVEGGMTDEAAEQISNMSIDTILSDKAFAWADNTEEAMDVLLQALLDPAFRVVFDGLLVAYSHLLKLESAHGADASEDDN